MTMLLPSLHGLDWDDTPAVAAAAATAFDALTANRWQRLLALADAVPGTPQLAGMCERYDFLNKLVLHNSPEHGYRVRLHLFRGGYFDRPHNHRWPFAATILTGSYQHTQYSTDVPFATADPRTLRTISVRTERPGDQYALHHTAIHSVRAATGTISLVLRGPATADSFRIIDTDRTSSFTVRGAASETSKERDTKRMRPDQLAAALQQLHALRPA